MAPTPIRTDPTTFPELESGQKLMDHEIRDMISALTRRLTDLQYHASKPHPPPAGSSQAHHHHIHQAGLDDDERGMRIITLAGSNTGATMRGELDSGKSSSPLNGESMEAALDAHVNSNFQAINNSIMLGGSYTTNDPGVHLDITEYEPKHPLAGLFKGKKKEKGTAKSDQHSEPNSE